MARYYVAGIPFDSRDALQHHGVKNMEWGKHKFGIDADDRYINYLNPSGSVKIFKQGNNAKIGYTDTGSRNGSKPTSISVQVRPAAKVPIQKPKSGLQKAISDVGKTVSGAYNDASRWAGQAANDVRKALGTGVDFVTGKTAQNNATSARNAANIYANSAELKKDKLARDLNATRNANAAAVQDAQSKFDQAKQNAANVNDYERMRVGGMADVYNSVPDARAAIAPEYTSRQNEARVNSVEANRQAAQARRDLDSARGQSGINQQQAENQARINMVNANRQAAQTQKAYEDAQRAYDTHPMTVAKDAINQAGNWIGDRANDVAKSGIGQWVSNAANDVGNAVSGAANQAGNWIGDRANDVGKAATNAWNGVSNAANQAGNWIGDRANDVAKSGVGQWVSNAANDVGNFVTGNQAKQNLENAKDSFFIGRNGRVANAQAEYDKTLPGMIENAGNWIGDRANDVAKSGVGQWVSNAANDVGNFVTGNQAKQNLENAKDSFFIGRNGRVANAQAEYDKTLPGMIENAGNWIGDRANDVAKSGVGQWVSNAANDVGQGANGFIDSAGRWISGAVNDAGNAISGAARDVGNAVSSTANNIGSGAKGFINSAGQWISGATNDVGNAVSSTANNIGSGAKGFINSAGQWISNAANDVANAASNAWNDVSNAAQDAGNWIGDRANDVGNAASDAWNGVSNAANSAGNWIGDRAQDVGNFVSEMANPHYQLDAERLKENYSNYLNEHPENLQSPKHEEWLKEQIKNDPQLWEYYEKMMKHSDISDKPSGVSDTFWQNYLAHGGTREQYDKDWAHL